MANTSHCIPTVSEEFFKPLFPLVDASPHLRRCPSLPDSRWLELGISRVLGDHRSGRSFLQQTLGLGRDTPTCQHFFESLKSPRRLRLCRDASSRLFQHAAPLLADALAGIRELAGFEILAGDGHWIAHACHDPARRSNKGEDTRYPTGHFYLLDLRRHLLRHLALGDQVHRRKEHDMRALKRAGAEGIRLGIARGRKAVLVWDPAGIDFHLWHDLKHGHGIYFISRPKENLSLLRCGELPWDRANDINRDVERDEQVGTATAGMMIRRVTYTDPDSGKAYEFITNEMTLPPGIIALLYRMRWDIEKVFDELKNKLGQTKAWAKSATAKEMQAQFICIAHNLMRLLEEKLAAGGIGNAVESKRRMKRVGMMAGASGREEPAGESRWAGCLRAWLSRFTQRGVKFIRWLRAQLLSQVPWNEACDRLRTIYARC